MKTILIATKIILLLMIAVGAYLASAVALGVSPYGSEAVCAGVVSDICAVIIM